MEERHGFQFFVLYSEAVLEVVKRLSATTFNSLYCILLGAILLKGFKDKLFQFFVLYSP